MSVAWEAETADLDHRGSLEYHAGRAPAMDRFQRSQRLLENQVYQRDNILMHSCQR